MIQDDDGLAYIGPPKLNPKEAPVILTFSSGTTGLPKAVVHTHYGIITSIMQLTHPTSLKFSLEDIVLSTYPFCHLSALMILCAVIKNNASLVVAPCYDFDLVLKVIPQHKPNVFLTIVSFVYKLLMDPKVQDYDLTSIKEIVTVGAPLNWKANEEVIMNTFPFLQSVRQAYGLSETILLSIMVKGSVLPNSVGKLVSSTELKVIDITTGVTLGPNECGEIYVRGEQMMKGYLNNPKITSETITTDGWLVTGDYGYYDLEGNVYITDRIKEMIKTEFYQVSPIEIESLLCSHPAVGDAAVIGIVDSSLEEVPRGYVVLKQGCKVEPAELIQFVSDRVSHPKRLRGGIEVLDKIPRSEMGKIQRKILQNYYYQNYK
ncbi:4-coumarate--CoA ligase 1-like [Limulus polyphemus]|uniref:4-coumarate--CoA ligase 1-like n=1 Tax=Limulus polyphemus TaxID=6850 RepID=A0ABM1TAZ3_LIMPO|nr:4-coumarate--CoA ligase 1-like [Limulus polyphemus]XP_022253049.1 4-coumarate--CoA ligase 1-like [Limulus polyphemus]